MEKVNKDTVGIDISLIEANGEEGVVCTTARVLGGHKSARFAKNWAKNSPCNLFRQFYYLNRVN